MKKIPVTLQIAQTECGLCCVRSMLDYLGYTTSITELRKIKEPGRDGLNMKSMKHILEELNVYSKMFKVKNNKFFDQMTNPVIAFWKGYHFVCIESFDNEKAVIMDPSVGRIAITKAEFEENFSGYILTAITGENFNPQKKSTIDTWRKDFLYPNRMLSSYIRLGLISLLIVAMTISLPIITQNLIDGFMTGEINTTMTPVAIICMMFMFVFSSYFRAAISIKIVNKFDWHLLNGAFTKLLSLPAKYFTVRSPGEIVYRLNALTQIQSVLGPKLVQSFLDLISGIAVILYAFYLSIWVGLLITLLILLTFLFLFFSHNRLNEITDKEISARGESQSIQLDALVSINSVKLGGYSDDYLNQWRKKFDSTLDTVKIRSLFQDGIIGSVLSGTQIFAPIIVLIVSLFFVDNGALSIGEAMAIQTVCSLAFNYETSVFSSLVNFGIATKYVSLAEDIFEYESERIDGDKNLVLKNGNVRLVDVYFDYNDENQYSLKNIDLNIQSGQTVALVGPSGSGKTTMGKVISSLFLPTTGMIFFGDVPVSNFKLKDLRSKIGYIPQETHLHNRTILENLALGNSKNEREIIAFCQKLKFLNFIDNLPMGYKTMVSDGGANFSGGQRQMIQIAKVLLRNPQILVMDEATSALDNVSQSVVSDELHNLNATKIIIAHRLETIIEADLIVVIDGGEILQTGTHQQLMSKSGLYRDLYQVN